MENKQRFANLSDQDLQKLIENKDAANTKRATEQAVKIFRSYLKEKQLPENFETCSSSALDDILAKFYVELRKQSGDLYKKTSFNSIRHGKNRKLENFDIINGTDFPKSQRAFQAMTSELKKQGTGGIDHHPPIEPEDLRKLYSYLDIADPEMLQQKVFVDIMLHFGRRGRENLRSLAISDFAMTTDAEGSRYIYIRKDEQTKNHQSDTNAAQASMHEISSQDEKCPIHTFLKYKRMLSPGCNVLFPKPLKSPTSAGYHYSKQSVGHNKLGSMMATLSEKAQLSRRYTNHSLRATSVHVLDSANIPTRHIMTVTGHKAEASLKIYTGFTDQKTKKAMSHTISRSLGLGVNNNDIAQPVVAPVEQNHVPLLENIDFLTNSTFEPMSDVDFHNTMMEFNSQNDPFDEILRNLPVPNEEITTCQTVCKSVGSVSSSHHNSITTNQLNGSVTNHQPGRESVINYHSNSHALHTLPGPIISGMSANVTINYNFYNGQGN